MSRTFLELSAAAAAANLGLLLDGAGEAARRAGATADVVDDIRLCVSEAASNAVRHAYGPDPGTIELRVEVDDDEVTVMVRDEGRGFAPATEAAVADEGGYGLQIMEKLARLFMITSSPQRGTEILMTFGLEPRATTAG